MRNFHAKRNWSSPNLQAFCGAMYPRMMFFQVSILRVRADAQAWSAKFKGVGWARKAAVINTEYGVPISFEDNIKQY